MFLRYNVIVKEPIMSSIETIYHFDRDFRPGFARYGDVKLYQIGRRYCSPGEIIGSHVHVDWFELTVITGGSGTVTTGGERMKVKPGDVYFSYPADIHNILADNGEKLEYDYYAFDTDDEVVRRRLEYVTQSFRLSNSRVFRDDKISTLLGYALNEFTQNDDMSEKTLAGILKQIVVYALRDICDTPQKTLAAGNAQVLSAKISGYLDSHVFSMNALTELSEKFNYNYAYISEIYKKTTSKTPGEYFRERKMETAKTLVMEKEKKISEIAEMLNYSSAFAFSKAFKHYFGVSPRIMQSEQKADATS